MQPKPSRARRALVLPIIPPLAAIALGLALGGAQAQGFAGLSAGTSRADIDCSGTLTCDRSGTAWKVYGGYMLHPNFGVQADLYRQGRARLSASLTEGSVVSGELKGEGVGLYGLAVAREGIWSAFGKAGWLSSRTTGTARLADLGSSRRETHTHFGWGAGVGVDWTKNLGARLEYERLRSRLQGESVDVDQVTAGIVARF
ncbi:MAG: outer membrane beta-barrel protein [Rubrivivax sp.]|jgi:OOP family OmpA-OmpF porin